MEDNTKSIGTVAYNLGILALNANIEALHAAEFLDSFDCVISENLLIQARLMLMTFEKSLDEKNPKIFLEAINEFSLGNFYLAKNTGEIIHSSISHSVGKNLYNMYNIRRYSDKEYYLEIVLENKHITEDELIKSVLVSSRDGQYFLLLEFDYSRSKGRYTIDSFNVIANEIRKQSKEFEGLVGEVKSIFERINNIFLENEEIETDKLYYFCKDALSKLQRILQITDITNLLAIRARIEAAQSSNDAGDFDNMLNIQMLSQAKMCKYLIPNHEISYEAAQNLADKSGIDEFWVTNIHGKVEITNSVGGKDFTFTNSGQTALFMPLLKKEDGAVTSPPSVRAIDGKVYKFVGVSRMGGGILQIGKQAEIYGESTATGFTIVAQQVKSMAESSKSTALKMIEELEIVIQEAKKISC